MKIINLSQSNDREAFLDFRRGRITGSKAKNLKMLTRGKDRTPAGFFEVLAEKLAVAKNGEAENDRGLRLEKEAVAATQKAFKLKLVKEPGIWISDEDEDIMVSPDSYEDSKTPTYAVEAKCLDSSNHLRGMIQDIRSQREPSYQSVNSLRIGKSNFRYQIVQYFLVNEYLQTVYFTLYDDRFAHDKLVHYVIIITRTDLIEEIETQRLEQKELLAEMREIIKELIT